MSRRIKTACPKNQAQSFRMSTVLRLSTPKTVHPANIPNRPSVYWLDYIESNEALRLRTPTDLSEYYNRFYANLPRLDFLSRPKTCLCDSPGSSGGRTSSGIALSALNYSASPRIKKLAEPRNYDGSAPTTRFPPVKRSVVSVDDGSRNNASNSRRLVKSSDGPPKDKYNEDNRTGYHRERPAEMHGGDAPPSRLRQSINYMPAPSTEKPPRKQLLSQSHSNIFKNKEQSEPTPTGSDTELRRKALMNSRSRTKFPPLVDSSNQVRQERKPSRQHSSIKLPPLDSDNSF